MPSTVPAPAARETTELHVFLEDCAFWGWSVVDGAAFLHVAGSGAVPAKAAQPVFAVHVRGDGQIDLASSAIGVRVYGEWPSAAWLRTAWLRTATDEVPGTSVFSRWSGAAWTRDPLIANTVVSLLPWGDHSILRIERKGAHGTRMIVQGGSGSCPQPRVPPESERFDATGGLALPGLGMAAMVGSLEGETDGVVVAGAQTAVLRNSVGGSVTAVSSACGRMLISQWHGGTAEEPEPRVRVVRVSKGAVEPGEDLPAEPMQFAVDRQCHEWFVSADGALFEHTPSSGKWQRTDLGAPGGQLAPVALATLGERIWVAIGETLYVVRAGKVEKVPLPVNPSPSGLAIFLGPDEQADRLWVAAIPVNEKRGTILTTGAAPQSMHCDELAKRLGHD